MSVPTKDELIRILLDCWSTTGDPIDSIGSFDLPKAGYLQWTRVWDPGSDVQVEINAGGKHSRRMPIDIANGLAKLGWRVPVKKPFPIRNCWLRVGRPEGDDGPPNPDWFADAADTILAGIRELVAAPRG